MKEFKDMTTLERQIEVIKFCHKPKNGIEIADHFYTDERTVRRITNEYLPEFEFPIMHIDVEKILVNDNHRFMIDSNQPDEYRSSVHPICLALNLTEVYLLTVGLLARIPTDDVMYDVYINLLNKIYTQLSEYSKEILAQTSPNHPLKDLDILKYESESEMFESLPRARIAFAQKSGMPIILKWREIGKNVIHEVETNMQFDGKRFSFCHEGKTIYLNKENIEILEIRQNNRK